MRPKRAFRNLARRGWWLAPLFLTATVFGLAPWWRGTPSAQQAFAPDNDTLTNVNMGRLYAGDFGALVDAVGGCGIDRTSYDAGGALVTAQGTPDMTVHVASGTLRCGTTTLIIPAGNATISTAHSTLNRFDLLVASKSTGAVSVLTGTAAVNLKPNVPSSSQVLLARIFVAAAASAITNSAILDKRVPVAPGGAEFTPAAYGAKCDGSTDDATALQAMLDAATAATNHQATIRMPNTLCATATALTLNGTGNQSHVTMLGASPITAGFKWTGSTGASQAVLSVSKNTFFMMDGIGFTNGGARGSMDGLWLTGPATSGTQTFVSVIARAAFIGFHRGAVASPASGRDSSEILWFQNYYENNDIGWHESGFNTLNHLHVMAEFNGNAIGMFVNSDGGGVHVLGGSASNSTATDFDLNGFTPMTIESFRSEGAERFLITSVTIQAPIRLQGILVESPANVDTVTVVAGVSNLQISDSIFKGYVQLQDTALGGYFAMRNTRVLSASATMPIALSNSGAGGVGYNGSWVEMRLEQNQGLDAQADRMYPDFVGRYTYPGGYIAYQAGRIAASGHRELGNSFGAVRMLGFGTTAKGTNLRDTATFATSATISYTFTRTVTITLSTDGTFVVTSGALRPADLGKKLVVTNGTNDCGYHGGSGPQHPSGWLGTYTDTTHGAIAVNQKLSGDDCRPSPRSASGLTLTLGENEPDANYFVFCTLSADERCSISSVATSGFTVTSSNASSTATANLLFVR